MTDQIIKGTGNSRYLKSSIASDTTWESALSQLRAGTFPIDLNGINADGIQQQGTPLNKANLLSDETARQLGLNSSATVNDAFQRVLVPEFNVFAIPYATITATNGTTTLTATADELGNATIYGVKYGTWSVTATNGSRTASDTVIVNAVKQYMIALNLPRIFGVCWDWGNSSTALSRLTIANDPHGLVNTNITTEPVAAVGTGAGSSPFDNLLPWSGMYECNHNGTAVTYRKGESGFSRTANDTVIWIPEYYCKIINDVANSKTYYYCASGSEDGFTKMAGSGKFVGRYKTGTGYVTKSGVSPQVNMTRATCRTNSKKGGKWRMNDYATWCAYTFLYLVEFADWDSQSKIGRGYVDSNSAEINTGGTDSMTYHTGRADGTNGKVSVQYRGIEDPWGNVWEFLDGFNAYERKAYVCTDPSKYADNTSTGYTDTGVPLPTTGWIKKLTPGTTVAWAFFLPSENGGSVTTYIPDYVSSLTGWRVLRVGGLRTDGSYAGFFRFYADADSSSSNSDLGARLLVDPNDTEEVV